MITIIYGHYTLGSAPPTNLLSQDLGPGIVLISWTGPPTPPSEGYSISVTSASTTEFVTTSQTSYTMSFQRPGVYRIEVAALTRHLSSESVGPLELTVTAEDLILDSDESMTGEDTVFYSKTLQKEKNIFPWKGTTSQQKALSHFNLKKRT